MPPRVKVSAEAILDAALTITKEKGIAAVNARDIAKALGCSVQPIFSNFQNMENLKACLYTKTENIFDEFMQSGMSRHPIPFLGMGLAYINFAKTERNLFKFLFMSDEFDGRSVLDMIRSEENNGAIQLIMDMTNLNPENAEQLFLGIWLTTHGIAALMATNDCDLSEEMITRLLTDTFSGMEHQLSVQGPAQ